jgi:hypothetical protein
LNSAAFRLRSVSAAFLRVASSFRYISTSITHAACRILLTSSSYAFFFDNSASKSLRT